MPTPREGHQQQPTIITTYSFAHQKSLSLQNQNHSVVVFHITPFFYNKLFTTIMALVVESWKKVKTIDNYRDVAGKLLFQRIFEIAPGARDLFSFATEATNDDEMYKNIVYLKHSRGVIGTVDSAIKLLESGKMDALVKALKDLGAKHKSYGIEAAHYPIVGQALLDTLEKALGDDFTPEVKDAWAGVYGVIEENMLAGAAELV